MSHFWIKCEMRSYYAHLPSEAKGDAQYICAFLIGYMCSKSLGSACSLTTVSKFLKLPKACPFVAPDTATPLRPSILDPSPRARRRLIPYLRARRRLIPDPEHDAVDLKHTARRP
jgi:hypothetical protein